MYRTFRDLEARGVVRPEHTFLLVFAGAFDRAVFEALGYSNWTATNLNKNGEVAHEPVDARRLPYEDAAFDHVVAHAGLHHTSRPHQAFCEMYRVARRSVVFFEAQDSILMRAAARLGLAGTYEINEGLIANQRGGVDDRNVPNHIYRWTQREVEKVVRSLDPGHEPSILFFREWGIRPHLGAALRKLRIVPEGFVGPAVDASMGVVNAVAGGQGNLLAACVRKDAATLQPWIEQRDGVEQLSSDPRAASKVAGVMARLRRGG